MVVASILAAAMAVMLVDLPAVIRAADLLVAVMPAASVAVDTWVAAVAMAVAVTGKSIQR
jgi:hypothetical protein